MQFGFEHEAKIVKWIHIIQPFFFIAVIGLSGYRMSVSTRPTRLDFWPLVVSIKSLVFLTYEVLSEYYGRFDSLRANEIINIVETVFWMAAVPICLMGLNHCSATGCVIIGVIVFIVTLLFVLSLPVLIISWRFRRYQKQYGRHPLRSDSSSFSTSAIGAVSSGDKV